MEHRVFLSRRNLLTLLSKLNRRAAGEDTLCALIKNDNTHAKYPQTMQSIVVYAVEDAEYYATREPGLVHPFDDPSV